MSLPRQAFAITPNNSADLPHTISKLYVGGAGDIKVLLSRDLVDGDAVTLKAVPQGTTLELSIKKVFATGTGATLLIGFFNK